MEAQCVARAAWDQWHGGQSCPNATTVCLPMIVYTIVPNIIAHLLVNINVSTQLAKKVTPDTFGKQLELQNLLNLVHEIQQNIHSHRWYGTGSVVRVVNGAALQKRKAIKEAIC